MADITTTTTSSVASLTSGAATPDSVLTPVTPPDADEAVPAAAGLYRDAQPHYPSTDPFDPSSPVKVIIVGAGLAGIITSILLSHKVRNLSYTIYDKNTQVGGTWAVNTYPGVRCDVPSHCYQTTFAPNHEWSEYYSAGAEIQRYYQSLTDRYNLWPRIQLEHEVTRAEWDVASNLWRVTVKNLVTGEETVDTAPVLINAQGRLSEAQMPKIPGLASDFKGTTIHTADWDDSVDLEGKRIAIIGNGASGQQILPPLLRKAGRIDHYVRSKVWVTPTFLKGLIMPTGAQPGGYQYTSEDIAKFKADPAGYLAYSRGMEANLHDKFQRTILGSEDNKLLQEACVKTMRERVGGSDEWLARLLPDFAPGCKRLTPGPGYLESLLDPKVDFVDTPITHASEKVLVTSDGVEREVDVIIAATGFKNGFVPYFPTIGLEGRDLSKLWATNGPVGYPETYFGIMAPETPNYFFILQANSNGGGGSIPLQCEISATYVAKCIRKMQREGYAALWPSRGAVEDFNDLCLGYFEDKVVSDRCSSWLKTSGPRPRNLVWWPGSGHHRFDICREPRWEDFEWAKDAKKNSSRNRYAYFGSGWTERERTKKGDESVTGYLREEGQIDLALLHEYWNE